LANVALLCPFSLNTNISIDILIPIQYIQTLLFGLLVITLGNGSYNNNNNNTYNNNKYNKYNKYEIVMLQLQCLEMP